MRAQARKKPVDKPSQARVLGKAMMRAAENLQVTNRVIGRVVGLSESSMSRLRGGGTHLLEDEKTFELATMFIRLYRSLDAIVGGDDRVAAQWLRNTNTVLQGVPLDLIQSVRGLNRVVDYLDSRRAII